jgi:hypothetical protein
LESKDSLFKVRIIKRAFGITKNQALNRVENIKYEYQVKNDTLQIKKYLDIDNKYRGEHIVIQIFRPEGKEVESNQYQILNRGHGYNWEKEDRWDDCHDWNQWD